MTDRDALRTALAEVQHYSLTVEPDDSAYMELDRDGQYVLIEDVDAVVAALAGSEPAGLDARCPNCDYRLRFAESDSHRNHRCPGDVERRAAYLATSEPAGLPDIGVYPAASPAGPRTPWQDGWNAAIEAMDAALAATPTASPTEDSGE